MEQHVRRLSFLHSPVAVWVVIVLIAGSSLATLAASWLIFGRDQAPGHAAVAQTEVDVEADWRQQEYAKLGQLRGGLTLERFREQLGVPLFVTVSKDGLFTEYLFQRRDYWVQAVTDASGTVQLMSVTSCSNDFQPSFEAFSGPGPIVLNRSRFSDVGQDPTYVRYFTSGATANSYYYDEYYTGNPGNYKTYFVGINDACRFQASSVLRQPFFGQQLQPADAAVRAFRADAVANTYGETAVFHDQRVREAFQVGATRILVRTAPPYLPDK